MTRQDTHRQRASLITLVCATSIVFVFVGCKAGKDDSNASSNFAAVPTLAHSTDTATLASSKSPAETPDDDSTSFSLASHTPQPHPRQSVGEPIARASDEETIANGGAESRGANLHETLPFRLTFDTSDGSDVETDRPTSDKVDETLAEPLPTPAPDSAVAVSLSEVVTSIHATFPLLEVAYQDYQIAAGKQVAAWGAFDTKLKASSENGPLGYYETYRQGAGFETPVYRGGEVFGGYRIGRGEFQPWYLERQTNDGGEFKAGFNMPLLKDRQIDARRAELWRATYDRQLALPEIRSQLIQFVRDGSVTYWSWVAATQQYKIGEQALELATTRNQQLQRKVELGDIDPPVLQDNLRAIAQREAKLIDLQRKQQQTAVKLSMFYRTPEGIPIVVDEAIEVSFPSPTAVVRERFETDVAQALLERPEFAALDLQSRRARVDLSEGRNEGLPAIDAQLVGSQDVGAPTSSKRDKSPFELEAGLYVEAPAQRRKAAGKMQAARAKLTQIAAKRQYTSDKVRAELESAFIALDAAYKRLQQAEEATRLSDYIADVERRKFNLGESDLLAVVLREQYAIEAAIYEIDAKLEYYIARADYDAAMAVDWPQ
ncbi:Outer membrane efflux protein [Rosistilla carotiformis]|uniref:Outer membrane efflux protein n=1 Tax=Rosistilla carotiformis TaxID=2528017 RepID=A0A518JUQ3_9BACT|nr:TolC family protein [Rosistilla carotiformis]QDV69279.1 Outer membrane efflux protein [Rosistilla carotiformis]